MNDVLKYLYGFIGGVVVIMLLFMLGSSAAQHGCEDMAGKACIEKWVVK